MAEDGEAMEVDSRSAEDGSAEEELVPVRDPIRLLTVNSLRNFQKVSYGAVLNLKRLRPSGSGPTLRLRPRPRSGVLMLSLRVGVLRR
jgi:hypothetical protein